MKAYVLKNVRKMRIAAKIRPKSWIRMRIRSIIGYLVPMIIVAALQRMSTDKWTSCKNRITEYAGLEKTVIDDLLLVVMAINIPNRAHANSISNGCAIIGDTCNDLAPLL